MCLCTVCRSDLSIMPFGFLWCELRHLCCCLVQISCFLTLDFVWLFLGLAFSFSVFIPVFGWMVKENSSVGASVAGTTLA